MKKVFLVGYYGYGNFGDDILLNMFSSDLLSKGCYLSVLGNIKNLESVNKKSFFKIYRTIKNSDIVFFGGGGIFQDTTSFFSFLYYSTIMFLSVLFKKKVVLAFIGVDRFRFRISKYIFSYLLNKKNIEIIVRDEASGKYLSEIGVATDVVVSHDPSFAAFKKSEKNESVLGVNIRRIKGFWNKAKKKNLHRLILSKMENYERLVFYILDKNNEEELVDEFCLEFNLDASKIYVNTNNYSEVFSCGYLITMRYHLLLLSTINTVPCLSVYYDTKLKHVAEEFCVPSTDLRNIDNIEFASGNSFDIKSVIDKVDSDLFDLYLKSLGEVIA